jgi:hypothetical protein
MGAYEMRHQQDLYQIFVNYYKDLTGVDLMDEDIVQVNPQFITVSDAWETECIEKHIIPANLEGPERAFMALHMMTKSPMVSRSQIEKIRLDLGAVVRKVKDNA